MTKLSDGRVFECPSCGHHILEEVLGSVTQYSPIVLYEKIDGEWIPEDYGDATFENGDVVRIQCSNCGEVIPESSLEECFHETTTTQ